MSESDVAPRRVRVERGIYRRPTGVLEVGFKDETGRQRWRTVDGGILAARKLRDDLAARRARGESVAPKPKLRFDEAADQWLDGPVLDLRETTQVKYRCIVNEHLRRRFEARRLDALAADDLARLVREMRAEGKSEATIAVALGCGGPDLQVRGSPAWMERDDPDHPHADLGAPEDLARQAPTDLHRRAAGADHRCRS